MKKWLISIMAVATLLLAGSALADGGITLSPDGSTSTDASVLIDGQTVTITHEGTYQIAGTLGDGALIVESAENAKITLVLGGVSIKNTTGAAIQIGTADDVTIELEEGTTNVLQSGEEVDIATATEGEEASGGALQSKADLKIKGKGSLTVLGYLNNGIHCTKDLKIKNGNISVTALGHGIKGKKSVTVSGGTVTVTSGKDGITSDETENEEKGFVTIEGGEIIITSAGDGVSAETTLTVTGGVISIISGGGSANAQQKTDNMRGWWDFDNSASDDDSVSCKGLKAGKALVISGGSITIDAQDDALHTDGDMTISGGECILSTGDDGAHAELSLTVLDGKITVLTSNEGLEANQITLAGGDLDIIASDDGINANGGSDGFSGGFGGGRGGMGGSFGGRRNDTNNHSGDMTPPDNSNMQTPPDGNAPSGNPPTMPGQDAADSTTTDDTTDKQPVLLITGGKITVNADGDGLDSNGNLRVEGGDITVNGPSNGGNGALDIGTENGGAGVIAGGTLIALGTSSMAENFGSTSTQCAFLVTMNSFGAGETITITDSQGTVLYTGVTVKSANSVVFSSADLVVGETYTVTIGSNSATVTQSSTVVGNSNGFGGGFGRH
ncbi:MAG: carbohydrate-binding domain-containing protein [Clostridiales bacterium]|nr:carbohydrate-binding domain-containing protein [Clostridiales bacterium]